MDRGTKVMDTIQLVLIILGAYLAIGICVVVTFDLATKRIRSRISRYAFDTQQVTGENHTVAVIVTLIAIWVFYPLLIIGALKGNGQSKQT